MDPLNEMRKKFLIIGLTGPLRSGCSEAAEFFKSKLTDFTEEYLQKNKDFTIQSIYNIYQKMQEIKDTLNSNFTHIIGSNYFMENTTELLKLREEIESKNWLRRIIRALNEDKGEYCFTRIYMTEMLIKSSIEFIANNSSNKDKLLTKSNTDNKEHYSNIIDVVIESKIDKDSIKNILGIENTLIHKKMIDKEEGYTKYKNYLDKISTITKKIKQQLQPNITSHILQEMGDHIRRNGNPFDDTSTQTGENKNTLFELAEQANKLIKYYRSKSKFNNSEEPSLFVIETFRNPAEVQFFRSRYYEFYLFSIYATKAIRQKRSKHEPENFDDIDKRDSGTKLKAHEVWGQNVSGCTSMSDIALNNDYDFSALSQKDKENTKKKFYTKLLHYYTLIRMPGCRKPNTDEEFMSQAYTLSLRSSCICKQVGAVITKNGSMLAGGWNDVAKGQIGCGDRTRQDFIELSSHALPFVPENEINDVIKLIKRGDKDRAFCFKDIYSKYKDSNGKIKGLQWCRALHAEENAIIQISKMGGPSIENSTLYTTSFPCELCAKKICQSGINRVVYNEPYPSVSEIYFKDLNRPIRLDQFEGVKPHSFYRLFKSYFDDKDLQQLEAQGANNTQA